MCTGEPAPPLTWAAQESCLGGMGTGELSLDPPQGGTDLALMVLVCVMVCISLSQVVALVGIGVALL